jgi:hypothetical protein
MVYDGSIAATIKIKQDELSMYLQAEQAFASGAQSYKIGNRELTRLDMDKLHTIINNLMAEISVLRSRSRRRSSGIVPVDY